MGLQQFTNKLREWWKFDDHQQHCSTWHTREDFIDKILPDIWPDELWKDQFRELNKKSEQSNTWAIATDGRYWYCSLLAPQGVREYLLDQYKAESLEEAVNAAYKAIIETKCTHNWVSADNEVVSGSQVCTLCMEICATKHLTNKS